MDPTNANAVAGPSRSVYSTDTTSAKPEISTRPTTQDLPPPPTAPTLSADLSGQIETTTIVNEPSHPIGPRIEPTIAGADGIRVVPNLFECCQVDDLIALIASMLDRLIQHNDRIPLTPTSLTRFHSRAPPSINVKDYLLRIARYTNVEPCCLLILLPYVDKVCARLTTFTISSLTVHRFIIAGVSVGSKALSDSFCTNGRYARVGGVSIAEMNLLEKELCEAIDWRLTTTGTILAHYYTSLVTSHPLYRLAHPLTVPSTSSTPMPVPNDATTPTANDASAASQTMKTSPEGKRVALQPIDNSDIPNSSSSPSEAAVPMDEDPPSSASLSMSTSAGGGSIASASSSSIPPSISSSNSSPSLAPSTVASALPARVLPPSNARHATAEKTGPNPMSSSPALIPAPADRRRQATASNLPSPVRGVHPQDDPMSGHLLAGLGSGEGGHVLERRKTFKEEDRGSSKSSREGAAMFPNGSPLVTESDGSPSTSSTTSSSSSSSSAAVFTNGTSVKRTASKSPFQVVSEQRGRKMMVANGSASRESILED